MINDIPKSLIDAVVSVISTKQITESTDLQFYSDIPNEQWLLDKQRLAAAMYNTANKGIVGTTTGTFNKVVKLPVSELRHIEGHRGEHLFRELPDQEKSKQLEAKVSESGFDTEKHPIYITVNHLGVPYINEGNHRLGYAIRHGIKDIHANVHYFNGGERAATGILRPDAIKQYNKQSSLSESSEHPMIEVDGAMKHRHNSMGQPIHHTDEGIRNFHRWFGDSKAVDEHGRPKVVYHATNANFDEFDRNKASPGWNSFGRSFYFADKSEATKEYGNSQLSTHVRIERPYEIDDPAVFMRNMIGEHGKDGAENARKNLIDKGFDGLHYRRSGTYVAFNANQIKSIDNSGAFSHPTKITESEDYREEHTSPDSESGAPAHDLTKNAYPEDFYSNKGHQYYGDGRDDDKIVHAHLKSLRNRPEAEVKIYRAVPNKDEIKDINPGDWVAITHNYAKDHGELRFGDDHKILTKTVKAKELFTSGDSFHEFGYHPSKQQHYTMSDSVRKAYMNMQND